jgi:hypothetical protein
MPDPSADQSKKKIPTWLWWTGGLLGVAGIGGVAWYVLKERPAGASNPHGGYPRLGTSSNPSAKKAGVAKRLETARLARDNGELDDFTRSYIETALWSTNDESDESGGVPLDQNYGIDDIDLGTLAQMIEDAKAFQADEAADLAASGLSDERSGHDFWLTRERHGAGYWDEGIGAVGDRLTEAAHAYGSFYLYVGDDGKIHS